jgi:hypothetical protein
MVDLVDDARLVALGSRWKCKVGITTRLSKNRQFTVNSATAPIVTAVRERPIAVNKAVFDRAAFAIPREQLVSVGKHFGIVD